MSPARVEVNNQYFGEINGVDNLDIPNPANPLSFGGRVSYYGDNIPYVQIIYPEGKEKGKVLSKIGDTFGAIMIVPDSQNVFIRNAIVQYLVTVTRT